MPRPKLSSFDEIVGEIYEAAIDPSRWHTIVRQVEKMTNSDWGMICWRTHNGLAIYGLNEDFCFMDEVIKANLTASEYTKNFHIMTEGSAVLGTDMLSVEQMKKTEFYQELGRHCSHLHMLGSILRKSDTLDAAISWSSGERRDPYQEKDRGFLARLLPHIRRSLRLSSILSNRSDELDRRDAALEQLRHGIVLIDRKRKILFANQLAALHFLANDRLICRNNRLYAVESVEDNALQHLIDMGLGIGLPRPRGEAIAIHGLISGRPLVVIGAPMPTDSRIVLDHGERPAVILLITDLRRSPPGIAEILRSVFALTTAEARLVAALTRGQTTREYAEANAIRPDTVRKHLKTIFQKTDTKGQTDLVALASRLLLGK